MKRLGLVSGLFGAALLSGLLFLEISSATVVPLVARGTGPAGIQITPSGWLALLTSLFGTGGFTLAGLATVLAGRIGFHFPQASQPTAVADVAELTESFAALISDKTSRAAQRRFFFALVDAANLMSGCETSHDGGVVIIKYSGYADPAPSNPQGAKI